LGLSLNDIKARNSIVIIPACHNTPQLLKVLGDFPEKTVTEICVIVDCATKDELQLIENAVNRSLIPIHVLRNRERKGIGVAIREGIKYAILRKYQVAVVMAGNGKDQPSEIPRLLEPILKENCDYVQGSRFLTGGRTVKNPFLRKTFSRLFPFVWTFTTKTRCTDVTNGFRAYRLNMFSNNQINIDQSWLNGYELEYYIHYKALTLGYRTKEVPVSKIYPFSHKGGYSNISPFRDWWTIVSPLIYLKMRVRK
jgi:dolichol-phosphate mannosyltransferase